MRYLPLEIAATVCALLGGLGASTLVGNGAVIAYVATWAENVGFYGVALVRDMRAHRGGAAGWTAQWGALLASARRLVSEFGPAELLDSFILRPALLYALPKLTGHLAAGLLLGKIIADIAFFGLAVIAYEWRKARG